MCSETSKPAGKTAGLYLLAFLALNALVAGLGGWATSSSVGTWYAGLEKPAFTPPGWVFGPAWTTLYALIGVGAWLVWRRKHDDPGVKLALSAYFIQLALNFLWSPLFFGLRNPLLGLVDILLLLAAILWMLVLFYRISKAAALLCVPYLLWVGFATILNFEIVRLN